MTRNQRVQYRYEELLRERNLVAYKSTDSVFRFLLIAQWAAAVSIALFYSPRTWIGAESQVHFHVWLSIIFGGALTLFPLLLIRLKPGSALTRHVIAIAQMSWSALLIHLTGGRIETHFHIFGSLAILAFYRDWKVLATATVVVAADHFFRGVWWPQSVFGVAAASPFRWVEHAGWVLFENAFLVVSIFKSNQMVSEISLAQAEMESEHRNELELHTRAIEEAKCGISILDATDPRLPLIYVNSAFEEITGRHKEELLGGNWDFVQCEKQCSEAIKELETAISDQQHCSVLLRNYHSDGSLFLNEVTLSPVRDEVGALTHFLAIHNDVTIRENAKQTLEQQKSELAEANENLAREMDERAIAQRQKEELNKQLITASRQAGMAEVATGVLHNVGNVMNSINVSVDMLLDQMDINGLERLRKVIDLIDDPNGNLRPLLNSDPKGKQLPDYLKMVADEIEREQTRVIEEAKGMRSNVSHVAEIVSMQQSYARLGGLTEEFTLSELCEDAIKINDAGLLRHGVELTTELSDLPMMWSEKHKVLQILVNFVSNAKYATSCRKNNDKKIKIRAFQEGESYVAEVIDNGVGIKLEDQEKIFRHGFTTKEDGHGFGLHSSILAAKAIGGTIEFESDGKDCGATFRLSLPVERPSEESRKILNPAEYKPNGLSSDSMGETPIQ